VEPAESDAREGIAATPFDPAGDGGFGRFGRRRDDVVAVVVVVVVVVVAVAAGKILVELVVVRRRRRLVGGRHRVAAAAVDVYVYVLAVARGPLGLPRHHHGIPFVVFVARLLCVTPRSLL
jgi:hypothetical protein